MRVLRARGVEAESELAFAALDELLRPVLGLIDALPPPQAAALSGALALGSGRATDRFAVYVSTLGLLGEAAEQGPLLVLVDDAHWLDRSSAEALLFAARRLEAEGIALVFAAREGDPDRFEAPGFDELRLEGLAGEPARELLAAHASREPAPAVSARLVAETAGNPLALIELRELLSPAQFAGEQPLDEPLAAGDAARRAFLRRTEELSQPARTALLVAAAAGDGELAPLVAALDALGVGPKPLEEVEAAGLLGVADGRLAFQHPLVRSAVYAAGDPAERRAAHRALAGSSARDGEPERRAWHLAAAAVEADEQVAAALEEAAADALARGGYAAAARALERAALLSPRSEPQLRRLLGGADAARLAGLPELALRLLDEALAAQPSDQQRAEIFGRRGRIEFFQGRALRALELLVEAAEIVAGEDAETAAVLLAEAAWAAIYAGDAPTALQVARRAEGLAAPGELPGLLTQLAVGFSLYRLGRSGAGHRVLLPVGAALRSFDIGDLEPEYVAITAMVLGSAGIDSALGRSLVSRVIDEARANGALGVLPLALYVSAYFEHRAGNWTAGYAAVAEAARIAAETRHALWHPYHLAVMALIEGGQGRERACRQHAEQAIALASGHQSEVPREVGDALGLLELGLGRPEEAIRHLEPVSQIRLEQPAGERLVARPSLPNLFEAYVRAGQPRPTELDAAIEEAAEADFHSSRALAERCRGLVAGDDGFEAHFERALELHGAEWPFERARTRLCFGERLRRAGRRVDARVQLRAALTTFERLGARPWAERAGGELRATGERIARRDPTAAEQLTPQELQIALTVARGATNREAGAALFLSPKTIEAHLGRVYRKLGLRSRTERAAALPAEPPAG